jgi:hypothetical protein
VLPQHGPRGSGRRAGDRGRAPSCNGELRCLSQWRALLSRPARD